MHFVGGGDVEGGNDWKWCVVYLVVSYFGVFSDCLRCRLG